MPHCVCSAAFAKDCTLPFHNNIHFPREQSQVLRVPAAPRDNQQNLSKSVLYVAALFVPKKYGFHHPLSFLWIL